MQYGYSSSENSRNQSQFDGDDPSWAVAVKQAVAPRAAAAAANQTISPAEDESQAGTFFPQEPISFDDAGLRKPQVEALALKFLLNAGASTGREIAQQIALPFGAIEPLLRSMKEERLIVYRSGGAFGDYCYELTSDGFERARSHSSQSTYFGAAPVPLEQYLASVKAQSIHHHCPRLEDIRRVFGKLVLNDDMLNRLGEALNMGLGLFLHGEPGNGKTSIAQRVTSIFGDSIWIPRAIQAGGEIIRLYDPTKHEANPWKQEGHGLLEERRVDRRWIRIRRPTMIVGGELQLENLEVSSNSVTGISEAPIQVKANGGTLVIDDLGRQSFAVDALLNRLIIPMDRRYDVLNLVSGRSFNVPFDVFLVFSTNLDPARLMDEAFLRRVPYAIHAKSPTEEEFRCLFREEANRLGLTVEDHVLEQFLQTHYASGALRFCHAVDLLNHVKNACEFRQLPSLVTTEALEKAVDTCCLSLQTKPRKQE